MDSASEAPMVTADPLPTIPPLEQVPVSMKHNYSPAQVSWGLARIQTQTHFRPQQSQKVLLLSFSTKERKTINLI